MTRRFAILSTYLYPLLGHLLRAMARHEATPVALILDSRELAERDVRNYDERTGGQLPWQPLHQLVPGMPVHFVESHNDAITRSLVDSLKLDFIVNGGTPRILNDAILSSTELGTINCHPGRLPEYRGCTCPEWAIFNGDPVCNTIHQMSPGIDQGPVLMIEPVAFPPVSTYQAMRTEVYRHGLDLLARASGGLQSGKLGPVDFVPQEPGTYYKPIGDDQMAVVISKLQDSSFNRSGNV